MEKPLEIAAVVGFEGNLQTTRFLLLFRQSLRGTDTTPR